LQASKNNYNRDDAIDLFEIFKVIWSGKYLIILITIFFALSSVFYSLSLPNIYTSSTLLKVSSDDQNSQLSGMGSQFSGIASMVGINMPVSGSNKSHFVEETLKSREFTKILLSKYDFSPQIIATKDFIKNSSEIIFDEDIYNSKSKKWIRKPNKHRGTIPTYLEVHSVLMKSLSVQVDKESKFITLSFSHKSPVFAKDFLVNTIQELNQITKTKDQLESLKAIDYLEDEILKIQQKDMLNSINSLISLQLKTKMLSKIKDDYLLSIIDPPYIPEIRSSPNRAMICIFFTFFGALLGIIITIVRYYLQISKVSGASSKI
jgi:uncharacterized protein involved in exopolysaccharide biosynthesis